ncbi:MAG: hypothetical protein COB36_10955 [Alphaproteobacteria bacterium]|nr:MAG: hypothetical protein COB36_10955 [Alphaproteobacteria bacterium]
MKTKKLKNITDKLEKDIAILLRDFRCEAEAEPTEIRFQSLHMSITNRNGELVFPAYEVKISISFP